MKHTERRLQSDRRSYVPSRYPARLDRRLQADRRLHYIVIHPPTKTGTQD